MRRGLLMGMVLVIAACGESRYGTYFNIDGDSTEIRFDHVRLFFGTQSQRDQIGMPSGATTGTVFDRDYDASSDAFDVPANGDSSLATQSEYWLPANDHNAQLVYVAAVASANGQIVGVGEVKDFKLEDGIVNKYDIELEHPPLAIDHAEVWGSDPGCFAWTKQRNGQRSTIAVLLEDDADCDGLVSSADCNDLCGPDSMGCLQNTAVCGTTMSCGAGCALGSVCNIEYCLPPIACSTTCGAIGTIDAQLRCVATHGGTDHISIYVRELNGQPCTLSFEFSNYGRPCVSPSIRWQQSFNDGWTFNSIIQSPNVATSCIMTMTNTNPDASFSGDHHVLISLAGNMPEGTIMVGVEPDTGTAPGCAITGDNFRFGTLIGTPFDCR